MSYTIKQEGTDFTVRDSGDQIRGQYPSEEQAKRRVRDLKRKDKATMRAEYEHVPMPLLEAGAAFATMCNDLEARSTHVGALAAPVDMPRPTDHVVLVAGADSIGRTVGKLAALAAPYGRFAAATKAAADHYANAQASLACLAFNHNPARRRGRTVLPQGGVGVFPARSAPRYPMGRARP